MGNRASQNSKNARNLRGIYSIDPDDEQHKDIIMKNARKKLWDTNGGPHAVQKIHESSRVTGAVNHEKSQGIWDKIQKMKFDWKVEAHESKRPRMESVTKKNHEDHIAGTRQNSISHYNCGAQIHSYAACDEYFQMY